MKKILFLFLILIVLLPKIVILTGCANIIPPSGGPRDTIPPVLLKSTPPDSTRNFTGNRITMTFDEFIDLQNVRENLIVSPVYKIFPDITNKLNTLSIKIRDTLEPNTTYSINFGNALKDFNEGNVLKNFTYLFSTGNRIDSLGLQGKVILAEDGKIDSTLIVVLHRNGADTAVMKERPRYMTRLDGKGNFVFKNLPAGTFYLYAFKDGGNSFRFTDTTQLFAFADKPVVTNQKNNSFTLYAYAVKKTSTVAAPAGIGLRKSLGGGSEKRLRFQSNIVDNKMDLLSPLTLNFEVPLRSFDSTKISFSSDSTFTPIKNYFFKKDSSGKKLVLSYPWKQNTVYHLILDKDFAEDTTGKKLLRTDTVTFTTKKIQDYGKLSIRFRNLDMSKNPVLIFIQNDNIKGSYPLSSPDFSQDLFLPGDYDLRILEDTNKNGKWDPGEFFGKHLQPEIVRPVSRRITVKPDYENEFEIEAPSSSQ
ncbi:MAG TPA: Ig-like domain-containing domain [Chitinophagaceae bacterium]|nr:Ig-like domain-containing domain [Chitinophagaceae bacterium]